MKTAQCKYLSGMSWSWWYQGFCWLFWELPPNLNWEILSTFLSTKYESEMNLGNNKQNNFAVKFISLNYSMPITVIYHGKSLSVLYHKFSFKLLMNWSLQQEKLTCWLVLWIGGISLKKFTIFTQISCFNATTVKLDLSSHLRAGKNWLLNKGEL